MKVDIPFNKETQSNQRKLIVLCENLYDMKPLYYEDTSMKL